MPKLSIVIPIYNVEPFLRECLDSIIRQTFTDWECFLVNDESTDGSGYVCRKYRDLDPRFVYLYQKNSGVSAARNRGIEAAQSEYLAFIDPDDYISLDFYELLFERQKEYDADIVQSTTHSITEDGRDLIAKLFDTISAAGIDISKIPGNEAIIAVGQDEIMHSITEMYFNTMSWNKIFRRSLWRDTHFPVEISLGEDVACIANVVAHAKVAATEPRAIYYYRRRHTSLSNSNINTARLKENLEANRIMQMQLMAIAPKMQREIDQLKRRNDLEWILGFMSQQRGKSKMLSLCEGLSFFEEYQDMGNDPIALLKAAYRNTLNLFAEENENE